MRVAVIGAGVSGLSTTWFLNEFSDHDVHLFESADRVGGHTNTVDFHPPNTQDASQQLQSTTVDTGFIVFNRVTYPNFLRFLQNVQVEILDSDMSFSVSRTAMPIMPRTLPPAFGKAFPTITASGQTIQPVRAAAHQIKPERGAFEWAGGNPAGLMSQFTNWFNPFHWRMIFDIIRFNHESLQTLRQFEASHKSARGSKNRLSDQSIGEWLQTRQYGPSFKRDYLIVSAARVFRMCWLLKQIILFKAHDGVYLVVPSWHSL